MFTSSGAMGALACDYSNERDLDLPELARLGRSPLRGLVRSSAVTWNPLDSSVAGGTTKILGPYLDELLSDDALGAVIVMHTGPVYADQIAQILTASRRDGAGRLVVCWPGAPLAARSLLGEAGVPVLEDAPLAFAAVHRLLEWADALPGATTRLAGHLQPAFRRAMLPYLDSRELLTAAQIPGPKYRVVNSYAGSGRLPRSRGHRRSRRAESGFRRPSQGGRRTAKTRHPHGRRRASRLRGARAAWQPRGRGTDHRRRRASHRCPAVCVRGNADPWPGRRPRQRAERRGDGSRDDNPGVGPPCPIAHPGGPRARFDNAIRGTGPGGGLAGGSPPGRPRFGTTTRTRSRSIR